MFSDNAARRVGLTTLPNGFWVSTVFLGMDHNYFDDGPPLLFETMAFPPDELSELLCWRCTTWEEAEAQHVRAVIEAHLTFHYPLLTYEPKQLQESA